MPPFIGLVRHLLWLLYGHFPRAESDLTICRESCVTPQRAHGCNPVELRGGEEEKLLSLPLHTYLSLGTCDSGLVTRGLARGTFVKPGAQHPQPRQDASDGRPRVTTRDRSRPLPPDPLLPVIAVSISRRAALLPRGPPNAATPGACRYAHGPHFGTLSVAIWEPIFLSCKRMSIIRWRVALHTQQIVDLRCGLHCHDCHFDCHATSLCEWVRVWVRIANAQSNCQSVHRRGLPPYNASQHILQDKTIDQ